MTDALLLFMLIVTGGLASYIAVVLQPQRANNRIINGLFWCVVFIAIAVGWLVITEVASLYGGDAVAVARSQFVRVIVFRVLLFAAMVRLWWEFR